MLRILVSVLGAAADRTARSFGELRPNASEGFGTLVEIRLQPEPQETRP